MRVLTLPNARAWLQLAGLLARPARRCRRLAMSSGTELYEVLRTA